MDEDRRRLELNEITSRIIGCAHTVANVLGCGFIEKVYENALAHELQKAGFVVAQQHPLDVWYDGVRVGKYWADLFVGGAVLVELKTVQGLDDAHFAQFLNYLRAANLRICLLVNFGKPKVEIRRIVNHF